MPSRPENVERLRERRRKRHGQLTASVARSMLDYSPVDGILRWKIDRPRGMRAGSVAGRQLQSGYRTVTILDRVYMAHRVAWFITHGRWPIGYLDHINGDPSDNRLTNLRECTNSQNQANRHVVRSASGVKGVTWNKKSKKWQSGIKKNGKSHHLGLFDTVDEARSAYIRAAKILFGDFAR